MYERLYVGTALIAFDKKLWLLDWSAIYEDKYSD